MNRSFYLLNILQFKIEAQSPRLHIIQISSSKTTIISYYIFPSSYQSIQHFDNSMSRYLKNNLSSMLSLNMLSEINHEEEDYKAFKRINSERTFLHRHINPECVP